MNKLFFFGLLLLTACMSPSGGQSAEFAPTSTPDSRFNSTTDPISPPQGGAITQSATASPVKTATQLPPEQYFTDEFDNNPQYWSTLYSSGDNSRVDIFNENGNLTFELYRPNAWIYAIYGAFAYDSVHLETKVVSRGSDINAMGLVCNYDEQAGWYEFNISSDGTYNLLYGQWLAEGIARYIPIVNDLSARIEPGNATNELGLDCYEKIVQLYINGKLIRKLDVTHIGLSAGKVGLSLASFNDVPVILSIDWIKVGQLESP